MWLILSNAFSQSRKIKFGYIFHHIPYSSLFGLLPVKSIPVHLEKSMSWRSGSMSAKAGITVAGRAQVMKRGKRGFPASPKTPQGGLQIKHSRATNQTPWTCNWSGRVCTASHFWHIFFFWRSVLEIVSIWAVLPAVVKPSPENKSTCHDYPNWY